MTRYSQIIGYLLAWQLMMPLLCILSAEIWWAAAATALVFIGLSLPSDWERNSYSTYSALAVAITSVVLAIVGRILPHASIVQLLIVLWIYAQIAFTATSPYPLAIRMPVIIYTLVCIFMIPAGFPIVIVLPAALIFASVMCFLAIKWKAKSRGLAIVCGPEEPPYSFSLATAIVAAVAINLCATVAGYSFTQAGSLPSLIAAVLLSVICVWLLCAKDWKKNALAVTALALMITLHILTCLRVLTNLTNLINFLSLAPVMFHTTAPVFRGMRIVITLFAVYSAINRHTLILFLTTSHLPLWQQHTILIAIDTAVTLTLLMMAFHWKDNIHASVSPASNKIHS